MNDGDDKDPKKHRPTSRLSRFARLSSMTANVAARTLKGKVAAAFQSEEEATKTQNAIRKQSGNEIKETFGELKGAAMKIGQMLSSDPELLPEEYRDALSSLQSEAPPMDFEMVRDVVEDALGAELNEHFSDFSEQPIGAASIGQVHVATTHEGQRVAVKVQYPGIADTLDSDLKNMRSLMRFGQVRIERKKLDAYFEEIRNVIVAEGDYLAEAENLERFQLVWRSLEGVRAPIPEHELSRKTVLTMEFIEGVPLWDYLDSASSEEKKRIAESVVNAYIVMMHEHGLLHADPHPGNFLVDKNGHVVFLDLGAVREYEASFTHGLLAIIEAMWSHDIDAMMNAVEAIGFVSNKTDPEIIYEWLELILEPLLTDREFDFATWKVHEESLKFVKDNSSIMAFAPPREAVFYLRVLAGLRGLLGRSDITLNAYKIAKRAADALKEK